MPGRVNTSEPLQRLSVVRRFLLWWFSWPANPYVAANVAQDFSAGLAYLAQLDDGRAPKVTVQHLLAGAVARALARFPQANARVTGGQIYPQPHVGMAMPVDLLATASGSRQELGLAVVEEVETLTLRQIAERMSSTVRQERGGRAANPFIRVMTRLAETMPGPAVTGVLEALHRGMSRPELAQLVYGVLPVTTALTNPGATFRPAEGQLFRGGSVEIPQRIVHVGTVWGLSALQDEVIVVDGQPAVRPMLPVLLLFDHRLIDGVMASRILLRVGEILARPELEFGPDGQRPPSDRITAP